ncbi:MAG: inositol monophosphatase family protein, partial [Acidiferrobacter sp.]
ECTALGSAWKFGWLAEGRADLYPRFGPTHTWDTAAGQCLLEEAGGAVWVAGREPLVYHHPRQLNPSFVAVADARYPWPDLLQPEV